MSDNNISASITLEDDFSAAFRQTAEGVAQGTQRMTDSIAGVSDETGVLGGKFKELTTAFASGQIIVEGLEKAFDLAKDSIVEYTKAGLEAEETSAHLTAAIEGMGKQHGFTEANVKGLSESLQKQTVFSKEALDATQAMVIPMANISSAIMPDLMKATTAVTASLGGSDESLSGVARALAIALDDPVQGIARLKRESVDLTEAQKEQIKQLEKSGDLFGAQKQLLDDVNEKYGTFNERLKETDAGKIKTVNSELKDMQAQIGQNLTGLSLMWANIELGATKAIVAMTQGEGRQHTEDALGIIFGSWGQKIKAAQNELYLLTSTEERAKQSAKEHLDLQTALTEELKKQAKVDEASKKAINDAAKQAQWDAGAPERQKAAQESLDAIHEFNDNVFDAVEKAEEKRAELRKKMSTEQLKALNESNKNIIEATKLAEKDRIDAEQDGLQKSLDQIKSKYDDQLAALDNYFLRSEMTTKQYADTEAAIYKAMYAAQQKASADNAQKIEENNRKQIDSGLSYAQNEISISKTIVEAVSEVAQASGASARAMKAIRIGQIWIDSAAAGASAASTIWRSAKTWQEGLAETIAIEAALTAEAVAQTAMVEKQSFRDGGVAQGSLSSDANTVQVENNELMIPPKNQAYLLDALINRGGLSNTRSGQQIGDIHMHLNINGDVHQGTMPQIRRALSDQVEQLRKTLIHANNTGRLPAFMTS